MSVNVTPSQKASGRLRQTDIGCDPLDSRSTVALRFGLAPLRLVEGWKGLGMCLVGNVWREGMGI